MARKSARILWAKKIAGRHHTSAPSVAHVFNKQPFSGVILGIDPSLRGTGLALVGFTPNKQIILHKSKTVRLKGALSFSECLAAIHEEVAKMIDLQEVKHVALEQTIYVQNFQTAQILGAARGVAIASAAIKGLPVYEYPPLRIKQAVVGFGRASKEQVARMLMQYLGHGKPLPSDEADAASVAICHAFTWSES